MDDMAQRAHPSDNVSHRLAVRDKMPTTAEYAQALHAADMLTFIGEKLTTLYAAIMHAMPIYRLYPATPEPEAIAVLVAVGASVPLIDGGPAKRRRRARRFWTRISSRQRGRRTWCAK